MTTEQWLCAQSADDAGGFTSFCTLISVCGNLYLSRGHFALGLHSRWRQGRKGKGNREGWNNSGRRRTHAATLGRQRLDGGGAGARAQGARGESGGTVGMDCGVD